ncbi:MAG: hypothetical protein NTZ48_00820 [Candidatus Omnitrophica bacterium]|nr:hypothetical protein [Candidatus Omnitrophota bacterium]
MKNMLVAILAGLFFSIGYQPDSLSGGFQDMAYRRVRDLPVLEIKVTTQVRKDVVNPDFFIANLNGTYITYQGPIRRGIYIANIILGRSLKELLDTGYTHIILPISGTISFDPSSKPRAAKFGSEDTISDSYSLSHSFFVQYCPVEVNGRPFGEGTEKIPVEINESGEVAIPIMDLVAVKIRLIYVDAQIENRYQLEITLPNGVVAANIDLTIGDTVRFEKRP